MRQFSRNQHARPLVLLATVFVCFALFDFNQGRFLSIATLTSGLDTFCTIGLVALGLGATMVIGEFDLSVPGVFGMAGCIAVLSRVEYPVIGLLLAVLAGSSAGIIQGLLIHRLRLTSIGVTLGGLLITVGVAYVLTGSASIPYDNLDVALAMNDQYAGVFTTRTLTTIVVFAIVAVLAAITRVGRDVVATGSDRNAALVAGVNVGGILVGVFAFSGTLSAMSGALLSYSLASASPAGLSDVLVPAATAAIIGGVSLGGGTGRPLGIAAGVLTLAAFRSGFNAIGAEPWVSDITTSVALLFVSVLDAPALAGRFRRLMQLGDPADLK